MATEIKDLIEKINREGIEKAETKAKEIESAAKAKAFEIVQKAQKEAKDMLASAQEEIKRDQAKQKALLGQSARDLMLSLRQEINALLGKLILNDMRSSLAPEAVFKIILELVKNIRVQSGAEIIISLKDQDRDVLEKEFLGRLKEEIKRGITLKAASEITGGFTISFDSGKTQFDFTDQSLAQYFGSSLSPKLGDILKEATGK